MVDQVGDRVLAPIAWPNAESPSGVEIKLMPGTIDRIKGDLAFVKMDEGVTYVTNLSKLQTLRVEERHMEPLKWTTNTEVVVELDPGPRCTCNFNPADISDVHDRDCQMRTWRDEP